MNKLLMQALRTVGRFKTYTALNLAGLVLSLSCAFVLARYIHQERTVDHFVPELERTFLLNVLHEDGWRSCFSSTENRNRDPNFRNPLAHPEVEGFTRFYCFPDDKLQVDGQLVPVRTIFADSLFLRFLPFPILAGEDAMNRPDMALISEELARRLWGDEDPLGIDFPKVDEVNEEAVLIDSSGRVSLKGYDGQKIEMEVYKISGELVSEESFTTSSATSVNALKPGAYILHLLCGGETFSRKYIVD